jgi:hypothetical protein
MTIQFEKLKARLLANPKVKAEYDALAPEFEPRSPDGANGSRECAPDDRLRAIREHEVDDRPDPDFFAPSGLRSLTCVRQTANLLNRINAIPPVQSPLAKIFRFSLAPNQIHNSTVPSR